MKTSSTILIVFVLLLALCCCLIIILSGTLYAFYQIGNVLPTISSHTTFFPDDTTPTPFEITRQPVDLIPIDTMNLLKHTIVPVSDLADLACRFKGICDVPTAMDPPTEPYSKGAQASFWANDEDSNSNFLVNATLRYITPHIYFWVEDGTHYNEQDLIKLVDTFENNIYPTNREFFGSEWTPGVDNDPHIYILYTSGLGSSVAGYFSSSDEYNPLVRQYSNAHEIFYIDSSESLSANYTYGTLAHEFQHMIHWYQDRNEDAFLNEGFSELAGFLNGYYSSGSARYYLNDPDITLTNWLESTAENRAHYGANFLFVTYFLDRFGEDVTKALVHDQKNGLDSIDSVLSQYSITDPLTEDGITADNFFLDWTITNYIQDGTTGDGRYLYHNYPNVPQASDTEIMTTCPLDRITRIVNQYGVDYIRITCPGSYTLSFEGATSTSILPADPHSGTYAFWSNKGDESDMTLTRQFDLSGVSGQVAFSYWAWYDLENDYDHVYLEASSDGISWNILTTSSGTAADPSGTSYGWGYTGQSNGWIQEMVDLSRFAGQVVFLRFEYITDENVTGEGFLLDEIAIPEINYTEGFESSDGGWVGSGFVRIQNTLPQTFRLAIIMHTGNRTSVDIIPVTTNQTAQIPIQIGSNDVKDVVLVVTATTRFTHEPAAYQLTIR
jgi:hypothetical protein